MRTAADQTPSWGKDPLRPGDPEQPSRTTEAELAELEGQVASNKDLKLLDMLRYYMRDSQAARVRGGPRANLRAGGQGAEPPGRAERHGPWVRDPVPLPAPGLLSWQLLALADYKNANKVLDKACTSNQVWAMESH